VESQYDLNEDQRFPNAQNRVFNNPRDYLLPIPQAEIDTYVGWDQNYLRIQEGIKINMNFIRLAG
jgi:hypothetical protein